MTTCEKTGAKATMMCKNCGSAQTFERITIKVNSNGLVADGCCWVCSKCHKRKKSFWTDSWGDPFIDSWGGWLFEMWPFGCDVDKMLGRIVDREIARLEAPKTEELEVSNVVITDSITGEEIARFKDASLSKSPAVKKAISDAIKDSFKKSEPEDCGKTCKQTVNDDIKVINNSEKAVEPKTESKHKEDLADAVAVEAKALGDAKKQHVNDKPYDDTLALFEVCNAMLEPWDVIVTDADLGDWVCEYYTVYKNEDLEFERWLRKPRMVIEKRQGLRVIVDGREIWVRDGVIYCDKDIGEKIDKAVEKQ